MVDDHYLCYVSWIYAVDMNRKNVCNEKEAAESERVYNLTNPKSLVSVDISRPFGYYTLYYSVKVPS